MSRRRDRDFLEDILEASGRALRYVAGMDYEEFAADAKTQDAVIRTLEIVGEATNASARSCGPNKTRCPGRIWPVCVTG